MRKLFLLFVVLTLPICVFAKQHPRTYKFSQKSKLVINNFSQKTQVKIAQRKTVNQIITNVFLGQAYPSGNVYLKAFEINARPEWAKIVSLTALQSKQRKTTPKNYAAKYVKTINVGNLDSFINFPKDEKNKMRGEYPAERDFFETVLDETPEDENVGVYKLRGKVQSPFAIFAFGKEIEIVKITYPPQNLLRPLTKDEKLKVTGLKKKSKIEAKTQECTTIPAFLDSAKQLLAFKIKGTNFAGRISHYSDAGCFGHLGNVYVLDIFENGNLKQSFELTHYEGAI